MRVKYDGGGKKQHDAVLDFIDVLRGLAKTLFAAAAGPNRSLDLIDWEELRVYVDDEFGVLFDNLGLVYDEDEEINELDFIDSEEKFELHLLDYDIEPEEPWSEDL